MYKKGHERGTREAHPAAGSTQSSASAPDNPGSGENADGSDKGAGEKMQYVAVSENWPRKMVNFPLIFYFFFKLCWRKYVYL